MSARISAFLVWALVALTLLFWGLRLVVRAPPAPVYAVAVDDTAAVRGDLNRLLGSAPVPVAAEAAVLPEANARFKLLGLMAPRGSATLAVDPSVGSSRAQGVALIAVDGKPARAYTVGTYLDDQLVLQSVSLRTAAIGPAGGPSAVVLEMPQLPSAATGTLPTFGGAPVPPARFVPNAGYPVQGIPALALPGQAIAPVSGGVPAPMRENRPTPTE